MSGGITDPPATKRIPHYDAVAQGATAKELRDSLADIPDEAVVTFVDSYEQEVVEHFNTVNTKVTAGVGFRWPAVSQEP